MNRNIFWSITSLIFTVAVWSFLMAVATGKGKQPNWLLGFYNSLALWTTVVVHEYGHFYAARLMGFNFTHPIYFVIGAFVKPVPYYQFMPNGGVKAVTRDPRGMDDVIISIGGPVLGLTFALFTGILYLLFEHQVFLFMTAVGFMINMFNLLPLFPLDGGRVVSRLHPAYLGLAFLASLPAVWFMGDYLLYVVTAIAFLFTSVQVVGHYLKDYTNGYSPRDRVLVRDRARVAAIYAGVLLLAVVGTHLMRYAYSGPIIIA